MNEAAIQNGAGGRMRRVYVAGPMRGREDWNRAAFAAAEERWRAAGWQVFSPAWAIRIMDHEPDDPRPGRSVDRTHLNQAMQIDLACLYAADAIALLPGWERSYGCTVELALSQFLGLKVYDAETMERTYPPDRPWDLIAHPSSERAFEYNIDGDWGEVWRGTVPAMAARETK